MGIQATVGVHAQAERLVKLINSSIPPAVQDFLSSQKLAIASTVGKSQVWASLLTGDVRFCTGNI